MREARALSIYITNIALEMDCSLSINVNNGNGHDAMLSGIAH